MGPLIANASAEAPGEPLTAYEERERELRDALSGATLVVESFQRRLTRCDLARCKGMCCYDGIYVSDNEAQTIQALVVERAEDFQGMGLDLPDDVIVDASWEGVVSGKKTATAPADFSATVEGFPAHFEDTSCVFRLVDGRCGLQILSRKDGKHDWYYKPFGCWLHPISVERGQPSRIVLHNEEDEPYKLPEYDGYICQTFCGRTEPSGSPAARVLRDELGLLGRILRRDLLAELDARTQDPACS